MQHTQNMYSECLGPTERKTATQHLEGLQDTQILHSARRELPASLLCFTLFERLLQGLPRKPGVLCSAKPHTRRLRDGLHPVLQLALTQQHLQPELSVALAGQGVPATHEGREVAPPDAGCGLLGVLGGPAGADRLDTPSLLSSLSPRRLLLLRCARSRAHVRKAARGVEAEGVFASHCCAEALV
jgi:hypothetical protein